MELGLSSLIFLIVGLIVGAAGAYLWLRSKLVVELTRATHAEEQLNQEKLRGQTELDRQKETYERLIQDLRMTEEKVTNSFSALATTVLDKNAARFKESAEKDLRQIKTEGTSDLDARVKIFASAVDDLKLRLKDANEKIASFETDRVSTYARLEEQMRNLNIQEQKLITETDRLKTALTTSGSVRGRWGELVLRNILQSSELMQHIDFEEQSGTRNADGDDLKPDFIIKLPHAGQYMVIDAKTSLYESYLTSETAKTETERKQTHVEFAKKMRKRVLDLSSKEYQKNVSASVPYVIMFVPGEAAIRAAFDADPEIFQFAMDRKVFIASPATIIPLLMLIANGWRQFKMSSQAAELSKVVETIGDRLNLFVDRLCKVQKGLEGATKAWNEAIDKSWHGQQSVQRAVEKARELGAQIPELATLENVQVSSRAIEGRVVSEVTEITETVVSITSVQPAAASTEG